VHVADDLAAPVDYSAAWVVVAGVLVAAVLLWNLSVLWWGRPPAGRRPTPARPADVDEVRRAHLDRLDLIEARVRDGSLDLRTAFQQLSATARSFVHEVSDVPATYLTLSELRAAEVPVVVAALDLIYPPEFAPEIGAAGVATFEEALHRSREVVTASWT
jgi:hypothetical protein